MPDVRTMHAAASHPHAVCTIQCTTLLGDVLYSVFYCASFMTADASNEIVSSPLGALAWHHVIGACLFLWGSYHQNKCHHILADLRKRPRQEGSGSGNYSVPYGDWFTYVSNPHYLAEVLLYVGVSCIMFSRLWTDWALPSFSFFILTISGKMTHSWYLETFDSYKKLGRRVIVPFVY